MLFSAFMLSSLPALEAVAEDSKPIDDDQKYAWNSNAGWLNFRPPPGFAETVKIYPDHLEGYVWGENIGWIKLGSYSDGEEHTYQNTSRDNWGVNNDGSGKLSGYAWSTNVGWINFEPECDDCPTSVTINPTTGDFEGYAWSETVEWINFQSVYGVKSPPDTDTPTPPNPFTCNGAMDGERWCDNKDGTVTDMTTGLVWLQNADWGDNHAFACRDGVGQCTTIFDRVSLLKDGEKDLHDGSIKGDWRLPTLSELKKLTVDPEKVSLNNMRAFLGVQNQNYWTATAEVVNGIWNYAWFVRFNDGYAGTVDKREDLYYVWPVRNLQLQ